MDDQRARAAPSDRSTAETLAGSMAARAARVPSLPRVSDGQLAALIGLVLFLLAAWPLALVDLPPLQDLPNHLATTTVIEHTGRYSEFVFNGFFKTNAALFTWLIFVGRVLGVRAAARLFVLVVLAVGAMALPRFVLAFGGRRRMFVASFFAWPLVHDWFVSMGMLDFALGVPLATFLLVLLQAQRQRPSIARGVAIGSLALATWYAHVFPLLVVYLLIGLDVVLDVFAFRAGTSFAPVPRPPLLGRWAALLVPLLPSSVLVASSLWIHATEPGGAMVGYVGDAHFRPPWELLYNLWAEWFYGFTWLEIASLAPCVAMGLWAIYRWREEAAPFGPVAFSVLGALYLFVPYSVTSWFHVGSRFIPFLWLAALLRLPERLPRPVLAFLAVCAVSYSAGMGVDYLRLDREWHEFAAGIGAVPDRARLLPLVFRSKMTSENTRSLLHAWGFYVVEKQTSAPLLFAHSRSFPVTYREPPPAQFNHLVLESFAPSMASPKWMCTTLRSGGVAVDDCGEAWRSKWAAFWRMAEPEFDHVLMWAAPSEVVALVPPSYRVVFQRGHLTIFARDQPPAGRAP